MRPSADNNNGGDASDQVDTWSSVGEAVDVVCGRRNLVRTIGVALVVGFVLFAINQLDVVMAGEATTSTWIKSVSTFLVPFVVANYGVLTATRRRPELPDAISSPSNNVN